MSELQQLMDAHREFCTRTFPGQTVAGVINHLRRECRELEDAPTDPLEIADCFLLLLDVAGRADLDAEQLLSWAQVKLDINRRRQWAGPDAEGVCSHVAEGSAK
jgi:hypothetical protein